MSTGGKFSNNVQYFPAALTFQFFNMKRIIQSNNSGIAGIFVSRCLLASDGVPPPQPGIRVRPDIDFDFGIIAWTSATKPGQLKSI